MNKYKFSIIILLSLTIFSQCTVKTTQKLGNQQEENFDVFLEKFLTDSTFQMSRIVFPVQGLPAGANKSNIENNYSWKKEDWDIHIKIDYKKEGYKRILQIDNKIIREQLIHPQGWFLERRFKNIHNKWFLIYYAASNSISLMK